MMPANDLRLNQTVYWQDPATHATRRGRIAGYNAFHYFVEVRPDFVVYREREHLATEEEWAERWR